MGGDGQISALLTRSPLTHSASSAYSHHPTSAYRKHSSPHQKSPTEWTSNSQVQGAEMNLGPIPRMVLFLSAPASSFVSPPGSACFSCLCLSPLRQVITLPQAGAKWYHHLLPSTHIQPQPFINQLMNFPKSQIQSRCFRLAIRVPAFQFDREPKGMSKHL